MPFWNFPSSFLAPGLALPVRLSALVQGCLGPNNQLGRDTAPPTNRPAAFRSPEPLATPGFDSVNQRIQDPAPSASEPALALGPVSLTRNAGLWPHPPADGHINSWTSRLLQPETLGPDSAHQWANTNPRTWFHLPVDGNQPQDPPSCGPTRLRQTSATGPSQPHDLPWQVTAQRRYPKPQRNIISHL